MKKELLLGALMTLCLGVLVGIGTRIAEWTIPAPEMRIVVCTFNDFDRIETCRSAVELLKKAASNQQ